MVRLIASAVMVFLGPFTYAQQSPGDSPDPMASESLMVTLRNAPFNMEPVRQPGSVRVDNRKTVNVRVSNLSPLDSCSPTRTPVPTTEVNPFQALLTSVTGLGGFGLGESSKQQMGLAALLEERATPLNLGFDSIQHQSNETQKVWTETEKPPILQDPVYVQFEELWGNFRGAVATSGTNHTLGKIQSEQTDYDNSARGLLTYLAADYRGTKWVNFNPECLQRMEDLKVGCASAIKTVKSQVSTSLTSIQVLAEDQGNLDVLTGWATLLHKNYDGYKDKDSAKVLKTLKVLQAIDMKVDVAKSLVSVLNDGVTALKASQTALRTAYLAAAKLQEDFIHRLGMDVGKSKFDESGAQIEETSMVVSAQFAPPSIRIAGTPPGVLYQDIQLGSDRKTTVNGTVACVSQTDLKTPTADTINYSILYQDLPPLSLSAGILLTFQQKQVIGVTDLTTDGGITSVQKFAVTDSARAQVFPMAFVSYHPGSYRTYATLKSGRTGEERLLTSLVVTGGIGVNSNSGKNQPEFFAGPSLMLNKMIISAGAHFGRVQSLGGGFTLGSIVPSTLKDAPPVNFQYKPAFAIGFSYRLAPW